MVQSKKARHPHDTSCGMHGECTSHASRSLACLLADLHGRNPLVKGQLIWRKYRSLSAVWDIANKYTQTHKSVRNPRHHSFALLCPRLYIYRKVIPAKEEEWKLAMASGKKINNWLLLNDIETSVWRVSQPPGQTSARWAIYLRAVNVMGHK